MRSVEAADPDRTARATIRDAALALFAERGPDAATVRDIAAAAEVSPALVLHHYGSKDGLRAAVDEYAAGAFDAMLAQLEGGDLADVLSGGEPASLAEAFAAEFRAGSPLVLYLRRLLLSGDPAGTVLVRRWHALTVGLVERLEEAGIARPSRDREARAALLLAGDLAVVLLAPHLGAVLGENPLTPGGMARWTAEATDVYLHGAFLAPPEATGVTTDGATPDRTTDSTGGDPT